MSESGQNRIERTAAQQQQPNSWKVSLLSAFTASVFTLFSSLGVTTYSDYLERGRRAEQERREVYGNIRGMQHLVVSLFGAQMNTRIRKEYYEALIGIIGEQHPQRGMYIDEVRRLVQAEETLNGQTAQALRELDKYVAMTEVLFPRSLELKKHTENVYAFTGIRIPDFDKIQRDRLTADKIENWYKKANDSARDVLREKFQEPTKALLDYLAGQMPAQ